MTKRAKTQRGKAAPRATVERSDVDSKGVGLAIAGVGGLVVVAAMATAGFFWSMGAIREPVAARPHVAAPAPPLQTNERNDRLVIEARARARLAGRDGGVPIDEAMRRTAALGWDAPR